MLSTKSVQHDSAALLLSYTTYMAKQAFATALQELSFFSRSIEVKEHNIDQT
jgi:hypothetical protein